VVLSTGTFWYLSAMHALLLTALFMTASNPPAVDPITEAAGTWGKDAVLNALLAIAQKRAANFSLEDNQGLANELILSQSAKWVHVDYAELDREIAAAIALIHRTDKPKLVLFVSEQNIGTSAPYAWWGKPRDGVSRLAAFEDGFVEFLNNNGWQFVEHDAVSKLGAALAESPSDGEVVAACKQSGGGRVLVGTVATATPGQSDLAPGMVSAHATIALHLLDCQTGRTVKRINETVGDISTLDASPESSGIKALRFAARRVADEVQTKILEELRPR
jgi:hypothetical protein